MIMVLLIIVTILSVTVLTVTAVTVIRNTRQIKREVNQLVVSFPNGDEWKVYRQFERDQRTDLCDVCRPVDHETCANNAQCACCRTTVFFGEERGLS